MNMFLLLEAIILPMLKGILNSVTNSKAPQEIIDAIQAAIDALTKVRNTPITRDQLESLKIEVPW